MKSLEEQADEILQQYSKTHNKPLRKELGILDNRRLRAVSRREIPMSELKAHRSWTEGKDE